MTHCCMCLTRSTRSNWHTPTQRGHFLCCPLNSSYGFIFTTQCKIVNMACNTIHGCRLICGLVFVCSVLLLCDLVVIRAIVIVYVCASVCVRACAHRRRRRRRLHTSTRCDFIWRTQIIGDDGGEHMICPFTGFMIFNVRVRRTHTRTQAHTHACTLVRANANVCRCPNDMCVCVCVWTPTPARRRLVNCSVPSTLRLSAHFMYKFCTIAECERCRCCWLRNFIRTSCRLGAVWRI